MKILEYLDKSLEKFCSILLIINVFSMLFFSLLNIVLRWFETSLIWIDPLTRHLVFVSTFLAAALACGQGKHIAIDILSRHLESSGRKVLKRFLHRFISLTTAAVLIWFITTSLKLVQVEMEYGKAVFWGIHSGFLIAVIPLGFGIICLRFIFSAVRPQ